MDFRKGDRIKMIKATSEEEKQMKEKMEEEELRRNPHLADEPEKLEQAVKEDLNRIKDKHGDKR